MNKLITLITISIISLSAFSGTSCSYDFYGNYNCFGTGSDHGYSSTTTRDFYGKDHYRDNLGNTVTCSTDFYGNYNCY